MKNILIILIILLAINPANLFTQLSGQAKIDSLIAELPNANGDTNHVNLLVQLTWSLYSINPDKGIEYGLKGVELAKEIDWKKGEADCYNSLGVNYFYGKDDYTQALEYYHHSLKVYEVLGEKRGIASTSNNLGDIYRYQSDYPQALEYYYRALKMSKELGNKIGITTTSNNIGLTYSYQSNYPQALEYYHHSLKIDEELGDNSGIAISLGNLGLIYSYQSDYPKALEYYHRSLKMREELGDKSGIANLLNNIGLIYSKQSDYPQALDYLYRSLKMREELGEKRVLASTLNNIGNIYEKQSDYPQALEYYHRSLKIQEQLGEKRGIAGTLNNIGIIYLNQSDYPQALDYLYRSLKVEEELGNKGGIASSLNNIGRLYFKQLDYPQALEYYQRSLKIKEELGEKEGIAMSLGNMGELYLKLSQDSVLSNIDEGTELVSLNKGINLNRAIEFTIQSIEIFEEIGELYNRSGVLTNLADAYKQKGDFEKALEATNEHIILKDSVFNQEKSKELGKLEATYEIQLAQKEAEAKEAEEARLRNEADSRRDLLQFSGITIFTIIIFAVIFFASKKNLSFTMLDTLSFLAFLLIYEFILVFADPYIDVWSSGEPIYKLAMNFSIALVFIPFHRIESKFKNKLKTSEDGGVES